jgi:hypothetical protein
MIRKVEERVGKRKAEGMVAFKMRLTIPTKVWS